MSDVIERVCLGCGETKSLNEFYKHPFGQFGRNSKCKECKKEYSRQRRRIPDIAEKLRAYDHKRRTTEDAKAKKREDRKRRRANDLSFKISYRIRGMLERLIKASGIEKKKSTFETVGYTYKQLVLRMGCQFKPGMTWKNYGKYGWHIDHKKPISAFVKQGKTDPKLVNALSNLQPLWAHENLSKSHTWPTADNDNDALRKEVA